jgi:hypothetical protein
MIDARITAKSIAVGPYYSETKLLILSGSIDEFPKPSFANIKGRNTDRTKQTAQI